MNTKSRSSVLTGPFAPSPSADGLRASPAVENLAKTQIGALLQASPAFHELPADKQQRMRADLEKIATYSAALIQDEWAASEKLGQTPVVKNTTTLEHPLEAGEPPGMARAILAEQAQGREKFASRIHELGMFGVEGGSPRGPAPAAGSPWADIGASDDFRGLVGRAANIQPGGWRPPARPWNGIPPQVIDQIGIGLLNIRAQSTAFAARLPQALRPSAHDSSWAVVLGFMSWSAGAGAASRSITGGPMMHSNQSPS